VHLHPSLPYDASNSLLHRRSVTPLKTTVVAIHVISIIAIPVTYEAVEATKTIGTITVGDTTEPVTIVSITEETTAIGRGMMIEQALTIHAVVGTGM